VAGISRIPNFRKLLGSGGAGSVYLAVHKHELVAVKKLHNPDLENERNEFIMEMRLLAELDSPYIIRYLGGSLTNNILVTEFMQNGDLRYAIMTQNPMVRWENRGAAILLDIARGLAFLHGQRFIHRDLKSPNILLSSDFRAKLADVGIARALAPGKNQIDTLSVKFSLRWASPENFTQEDYTILSERSDIYGFGVILWEVMAQSFPWDHIRWEYEICNLVKAGQHNPIPDNCPPRVAALMKACWALNPDDRPSATQVVAELEDILLSSPPLEPVENLVLRFTGSSRDGDPKLGPDGNLILKEGTLSLRSVWLQMWHIRYFTLTQRNIIYWTYQNNQKAREIRISLFKLRKTKFYRNASNSQGCMFEFVTFSRTYTLVAPSVTEAADWVAAIELAKGNTTSTRDTVMADAEDHPNPEMLLESYQATNAVSGKAGAKDAKGRPKASTLRPKKPGSSAGSLASTSSVPAIHAAPAAQSVKMPVAGSGSGSAPQMGANKIKTPSKTMRPSKSGQGSSKFSLFPRLARGSGKPGGATPVTEALPGFALGDNEPPSLIDSATPSLRESDRSSTSSTASGAPSSTSSAKWASGSVKFDSNKFAHHFDPHSLSPPASQRIGSSSAVSDTTYSTSTTAAGSNAPGSQLQPASLLISKSAPQDKSKSMLGSRKPVLSQPEPVNATKIAEIEIATEQERQGSIESNEEEVTEIGIPPNVMSSLKNSQAVEKTSTSTGTMTGRNGDILTACYYCADEHNNQPPPRVLNLTGVRDYQELFEAVFDGFLTQLDGRGFSLWSKLVDSKEEYEILDSEFEDWKECISRVDRINVKAMSTPKHIHGDNDHSEQIFRRSVRMSVPLNFGADWKKILEHGLGSLNLNAN
jgi:serine/threonine protein kinase